MKRCNDTPNSEDDAPSTDKSAYKEGEEHIRKKNKTSVISHEDDLSPGEEVVVVKTKKLTRHERKQLIKDELIAKKVEKKVHERVKREKIDMRESGLSSDAILCITLGRMAYDLARSGTAEQVQEMNVALPFLLAECGPPSSSSSSSSPPQPLVSCTEEALLFAEAAYLFALSGISMQSPLKSFATSTRHQHDQYHPQERSEDNKHPITVSDILMHYPSSNNFHHLAQAFVLALPDVAAPPSIAALSTVCTRVDLARVQILVAFLGRCSRRGDSVLNPECYWLHSPCGSPLTALWFHSTKQKKIRVGAAVSSAPPPGIRIAKLSVVSSSCASKGGGGGRGGRFLWAGDSPLGFDDLSLPLVVDVGCGFGVSLLGLAAVGLNGAHKYNYLGCDLSSHCIQYASGVANQWQLQGHCRFCVAPAEDFLEWVLGGGYPGGAVAWISVQYPTPYKFEGIAVAKSENKMVVSENVTSGEILAKARSGQNAQLPLELASGEDSGFMVSRRVIDLCVEIAVERGELVSGDERHREGRRRCGLYVQSNAEDVAVTLRKRFELSLSRRKIPLLQVSGADHDGGSSFHMKASSSSAVASHMKEFNSSSNDWNCFPHNLFGESNEVGWEELKCSERLMPSQLSSHELGEEEEEENIPRRQKQWIAEGGDRADPSEGIFLSASPLPHFGFTETEAAYQAMKKPVHRVGWIVETKF